MPRLGHPLAALGQAPRKARGAAPPPSRLSPQNQRFRFGAAYHLSPIGRAGRCVARQIAEGPRNCGETVIFLAAPWLGWQGTDQVMGVFEAFALVGPGSNAPFCPIHPSTADTHPDTYHD